MTKAEKERMSKVADLGCIVCKVYHGCESPALIHHLVGSKFRSTGKKASNQHIIPLCHHHHVGGSMENPSIHAFPKAFNMMYGSQEYLYGLTLNLLGELP